ncbi:hypothetical protein VRU48_10860 [Pedobacter sp. KR3-3]|uniref:DUF4252 domain-containing protein n=1 Tax=Pedobacter albus TaxID=3113905 RepID=A0ABU7I8A4_9SPHI|nr:hypothetical protein [Pedobacter sp. KR3-3]MEE1945606.1 hypothetical protein [Pedobacter sp. KR3-3]
MKSIFILICTTALTLGLNEASAQNAVDRGIGKAQQVGNTVDNAKNTADKLLGLFGKKKKTEAESTTVISINGGTLATIKQIKADVEACKGVTESAMKFSSSGSKITVKHAGTTEDLLKLLQTKSTTFGDKNITGIDEGEIGLKVN